MAQNNIPSKAARELAQRQGIPVSVARRIIAIRGQKADAETPKKDN